MKLKVIIGLGVMIACMCLWDSAPAYASGTISQTIGNAGIGTILDSVKTEEEYIEAIQGVALFGYNSIGMANVENHLNIRETPDESGKLVGKMSNNAACEVLSIEGDWAKIKSGKVEGYCHTDYLLTGILAKKRAEDTVSTVAVSTSGGLRVREAPGTDSEIITTMGEGESLDVLEELDGWIKVQLDDEEAYISSEYAQVKQELPTAITMTELLYGEGVSDVRVDLCQYAQEFIGNPYVWGGTSLTKGADCSGFTLSIFKKYGFNLPHSAASQSKLGTDISLSEAKAGDLVFYAKGGRVNHVAIYIGNGQVVHASNPKTGIRISAVSYRTIHNLRRIIND